ncbi:MAG: class I SAM-dependent methyltransferase [Methanoregula sp.]|nr:class I SAM-dependent methyltransferase [Methanoregula sp.]
MTTGINDLWKAGPGGPSRIAEGITLQRMAESMLPEDVRIFYDPYAVHFVDPAKLAWARDHPAETQAMVEVIERKMPGWSNTIRARVRFFDDVVGNAAAEGFSQLVIPGAGYDTRAYRIESLKGHLRVFEIDRPETLARKTGILKTIFETLPDHVAFVPHEIGKEPWWQSLEVAGFIPAGKTLFLLEGLVMYLPRPAVEDLLAGIAGHAGVGSAVLFDFVPQSLADGSSDAEGGQEIRESTIRMGEPILSGFAPGEVVPFLAGLGFGNVQVISSPAYTKMYYTGKNAGRKVSGLLSFAYAKVPGGNRT